MNGAFVLTPVAGFVLGLLAGMLLGGVAALVAWRSGRRRGDGLAQALEAERQARTVAETRLEEQARHFEQQKATLEAAEKRLNETFERTAGKLFEERAKQFSEMSEKQIGTLLQPLSKDLGEFKKVVDESNKEDIRRHAEMQEKIKQLQTLNLTLHEDAQNLTRALTRDVKAQGNWGEQQLERLMELAGLRKGQDYFTQYSVTVKQGSQSIRLQPDFVLQLPGGTSIILDSKVSLTAWTEYQSAPDDATRAECLKRHVQSLRNHIVGLNEKNYPQAEELNPLPFVLMFVPIESAMIAALQADATLAEFALRHNVSLLSPANFLATARTVASVWQIHNQSANAREIARRGGMLYDKFRGFADNLQKVDKQMDAARDSFRAAYRQLIEGPGNLVSQVEMLRELGAKANKQMDTQLVQTAVESDPELAKLRALVDQSGDASEEEADVQAERGDGAETS